MAFAIQENVQSPSGVITTPGQSKKLVRVFTARIDAGASSTLTNAQEILDDLWSQHGVAVRERFASGSPFVCRNITFDRILDSPHYDITAEYETFGNIDSSVEGFVARPPFVRRQTQSAERSLDLYREGSTIPANGDPTTNNPVTAPDIGGTAVDQQGRPIVVPVSQIEFQIDTHYDTTTCFSINESLYLDRLNTRNNAIVFNFPIGMLLFKSFVISEIGSEWYQITHRFVGDPYFHMKQVPKLNINGDVQLTATSGIGNASAVYWFQPYPVKSNFADLFTLAERNYLSRSCPP